MDQQTVVQNVVRSKSRPEIPASKRELIKQEPQLQKLEVLMQQCWLQNPNERPSFNQVCTVMCVVCVNGLF
jgi:hypothetical protein